MLRTRLAEELEADQDWLQAAKVLSLIPVEGGQKQYPKAVKLEIYMKIGQLYLEAEEFIEAENFIQRVGLLQDAETSEVFRIQHSAAFARIQDFRRKYIEASQVCNFFLIVCIKRDEWWEKICDRSLTYSLIDRSIDCLICLD